MQETISVYLFNFVLSASTTSLSEETSSFFGTPNNKVNTKELTNAITIQINAFLTFDKSSQMYTGNAVTPAVALAYVRIFVSPPQRPAIPPLIITVQRGFFNFIVTP